MRCFTISLALLSLLAGCRPAEPTDNEIRDWAYSKALDDLSGATFAEVGDVSSCTDDCSGHDAGFEYARSQQIFDEDDCSDDNPSFNEGCRTFAKAFDYRLFVREREAFDNARPSRN